MIKNLLSLLISSLLLLLAVNGYTGETTRVSVDSAGQQGNGTGQSYLIPASSADGRFVTFESLASNLVAEDTNGDTDIFVHDRNTGVTTRVSVDSAGQQGDSGSYYPAISADGRFVTFGSNATNLVEGDTNSTPDAFIHDRNTGATTRVSVDSAGQQGNNDAQISSISADGRWVAFISGASNLVEGDTNGGPYGVFVHDRSTGRTTRVSVNSAGQQGNSSGHRLFTPAISADGRSVAFHSEASNLVEGDTNATYDVFVHDRNTGSTTRVSINSAGQQADFGGIEPAISADGRFVTFGSLASNLVDGDTNESHDIFVHDRNTGTTTRVSVGLTNRQRGNRYSNSYSPAISADGRWVAFASSVFHLVAGDTNGVPDIFVRDRQLAPNKTADLQLAVTGQPALVQTGQTASYIYTLTNNGPDNIKTEVKLTHVVSNGILLSLTPSQGHCSKATVSVCRFGGLVTGASVTLTADIEAGSDPLTQQISVNAPLVDNAPDNNSSTVSTLVTP